MCWRGQIIDEKGISMNRIVFMSENKRMFHFINIIGKISGFSYSSIYSSIYNSILQFLSSLDIQCFL